MTIAVILEGGLVQCVVSDDPAEIGKEVEIIDYDTEGEVDVSRIYKVPQEDGTEVEACPHTEIVQLATINLKGIRPLTEEEEKEAF